MVTESERTEADLLARLCGEETPVMIDEGRVIAIAGDAVGEDVTDRLTEEQRAHLNRELYK
jgi:hypothetical protein